MESLLIQYDETASAEEPGSLAPAQAVIERLVLQSYRDVRTLELMANVENRDRTDYVSDPGFYGTVLVLEAKSPGTFRIHRTNRLAALYPATDESGIVEDSEHPRIEDQSESRSTITSWSIQSELADDIVTASQRLLSLLSAVRSAMPIARSPDLRSLATQIARDLEQRVEEPEIDDWARRLADDVSDATD